MTKDAHTHTAKATTNFLASLGTNDVEIRRYTKDLVDESDRGCALIVGAWLEDALGDILRAHFVDDEKTVDEMLGIKGAIGTFATRTDLCFLLGLITAKERENLRTIRRIRNRAAHLRDKRRQHQWTPDGFAEKDIAALCGQLTVHKGLEHVPEGGTSRQRFAFVASVMLVALAARVKTLPRCAPQKLKSLT